MPGLAKPFSDLQSALSPSPTHTWIEEHQDPLISGITHDSGQVVPGCLFVALRGQNTDGHEHIEEALERGAVGLVVERPGSYPVPTIMVSDTRLALAQLAAAVYDFPSRKLTMVGVTGTTGKTTVTHLLSEILQGTRRKTGLVGTVENRIGNRVVPAAFTTPEATELHQWFAEMVAADTQYAVLEVSSHALAQQRTAGIKFDLALFTNLGWDHMDFHPDREHYQATKFQLFQPDYARAGLVWVEDPAGRRLAETSPIPLTTVGFGSSAQITGEVIKLTPRSSRIQLNHPEHPPFEFCLPMPGQANLANGLMAVSAALALGCTPAEISPAIEGAVPPPGRFETIHQSGIGAVIIDYAHTPEAIAQILRDTAEIYPDHSLMVVMGAGGDRDRTKRAQMGAAAASAQLVMLTSDNPRTEDPLQIMDDIAAGIPSGPEVISDPDRTKAISQVLERAGPEDVVLVLGKGHEQVTVGASGTVPSSDRETVSLLLSDQRFYSSSQRTSSGLGSEERVWSATDPGSVALVQTETLLGSESNSLLALSGDCYSKQTPTPIPARSPLPVGWGVDGSNLPTAPTFSPPTKTEPASTANFGFPHPQQAEKGSPLQDRRSG